MPRPVVTGTQIGEAGGRAKSRAISVQMKQPCRAPGEEPTRRVRSPQRREETPGPVLLSRRRHSIDISLSDYLRVVRSDQGLRQINWSLGWLRGEGEVVNAGEIVPASEQRETEAASDVRGLRLAQTLGNVT